MNWFGDLGPLRRRKAIGEHVHTIKQPRFFKEFFIQSQELMDLEYKLSHTADESEKRDIKEEINKLTLILNHDNQVYNKIKNSLLSAIAFYDLSLEYDGARERADFVIISNNFACIIDSRSLSGKIEIDKEGHFYQVYTDEEKNEEIKERIKSPSSKLRDFIRLMKSILEKELKIDYYPFIYLSINADENAGFNLEKTSRRLADTVSDVDKFIPYLKDISEKSEFDMDEEVMYKVANALAKYSVLE